MGAYVGAFAWKNIPRLGLKKLNRKLASFAEGTPADAPGSLFLTHIHL